MRCYVPHRLLQRPSTLTPVGHLDYSATSALVSSRGAGNYTLSPAAGEIIPLPEL